MSVLFDPRTWIALAVAAALGLAGWFLYRAGGEAVQVEFTQWKLTASENRILADRSQRVDEQRKQDVADQEAKDATQKLNQARADAALAGAVRDRLHDQLAAYLAAVHRAGAQPDAAAGGPRQPGADPLDLLAQLYSRADDEAGTIGEYADQLRIVGSACERIADGLQPAAR